MRIHWQPRMALVLLEALCLPAQLNAQIVHDTTLGTACGPVMGTPGAGGSMMFSIRPECGVQQGGNLFHSFGQFNVAAGDVAAFSGSRVKNIFARVTGGSPSTIDGTLRADVLSPIPNIPAEVHLFLINPWGVLFGAGAQVDLNGSFTATTASYVKFADGAKFNAVNPGQSTLSMADPVRFGFLDSKPGKITVDGSALASSPSGRSPRNLALVGGDIEIKNSANLTAGSGGRISLTSLRSAGEFSESPHTAAFAQGGTITLAGGSRVGTDESGGGRIVIRGGDLLITGSSSVQYRSTGTALPGGIDIALKALLSILGGSTIESLSENDAGEQPQNGPIAIQADEVQLGESSLQTSSSIVSLGSFGNAANDVTIKASSVEVNPSGIIANIGSDGAAGKTSIQAGSVILNGPGGTFSFNDGQSQVQGNIVASTSTVDGQTGGDVQIRASSLQINGGSIANRFSGSGDGGDIVISGGNLNLRGGTITDSSSGGGNAGDIRISTDSITLTGLSTPQQEGPVAGIGASTSGAQGGNINIHTGSLTVDGAFIAANRVAQAPGGIGNVPPGPSVGADAANITINATKVIKLVNANIFAANPDAGGNVNFTAERSIMVQDSTIDASGGAGGGNVFFKAPMVAILDSILNAAAPSPPDGRVGIEACLLEFQDNDLAATAGLQADIMICETPPGNWPERPRRDAGWPQPPLPPGLPAPPSIPDLMKQTPLAPECGVKFDISSFIVRGRGGVALEPGGWQPGLNVPQVSPEKK